MYTENDYSFTFVSIVTSIVLIVIVQIPYKRHPICKLKLLTIFFTGTEQVAFKLSDNGLK